jgi:hypothetical protein
MHHRSIAILTIVCFAFCGTGCESLYESSKPKYSKKEKKEREEKKQSEEKKKSASKKQYQEVLMPLQTGSVLHRRTYVLRGPDSESKPTKKKKKEAAAPKPEAEPTATPTPEEEATPAPVERFR